MASAAANRPRRSATWWRARRSSCSAKACAAARAAYDYLYTYRAGKVSATLNMLSADTETKTFVVSRNNESPVIVYTEQEGLFLLDEPSRCVGVYRNTKPVITELPILPGTIIVVFTDGLRHARIWEIPNVGRMQ
jgi:hypothetical protein